MAPGAGKKERRNYHGADESPKGWKRVDEGTVIWGVIGNRDTERVVWMRGLLHLHCNGVYNSRSEVDKCRFVELRRAS
jgi:hypothetical protein